MYVVFGAPRATVNIADSRANTEGGHRMLYRDSIIVPATVLMKAGPFDQPIKLTVAHVSCFNDNRR